MIISFAKALEKDDFDTALLLIEQNQNDAINHPDADQDYPLHLTTNLALYHQLSPHQKKMLHNLALKLLNAGANPNVQDKFKSYPIHYAAIHGNLDLLKRLIECGADYNALDAANETPLHQAIRRKHEGIIDYLLSKSDLSYEKTVEGFTPADYAAQFHAVVLERISAIDAMQTALPLNYPFS